MPFFNETTTSITGFVDFIQTANSFTDGILAIGFVLALLVISFLSLKSITNVTRAGASSTFITMLASILLTMMDILTNNLVLFVSIILFVIAAIALFAETTQPSTQF